VLFVLPFPRSRFFLFMACGLNRLTVLRFFQIMLKPRFS